MTSFNLTALVRFGGNFSPNRFSSFSSTASVVKRHRSTGALEPPVKLSQRSWNVIRYHPDLKQAIRFEPNCKLPTAYRSNDILVRVLASSVNPHDIEMTRGHGNVLLSLSNILQSTITAAERLQFAPHLPLTLGRDFVGQIVARGPAVATFAPGDLVWGTVPPYETGAHADYVITSDVAVSHKPRNVSNVEAASIPYVGLTAWSAISTFGELSSTNTLNKKVLVLGGSGGVGCFAIQLLQYWGAKMVTTCSRNSIDWLRSLTKVNEYVDYRDTEQFLRTYCGTFDFILDASSARAARKNHQILESIQNDNRHKAPIDRNVLHSRTMYVTLTSPLLRDFEEPLWKANNFKDKKNNNKFTQSSNMNQSSSSSSSISSRHTKMSTMTGTIADAIGDTLSGVQHQLSFRWAYYLPNPKALTHIGDLIERGAITPLTTCVYDFDKALDAYESLEKRPRSGKVVLNYG